MCLQLGDQVSTYTWVQWPLTTRTSEPNEMFTMNSDEMFSQGLKLWLLLCSVAQSPHKITRKCNFEVNLTVMKYPRQRK